MCGGVALAEISFNFDDPGAPGRAVFVSPHQDLPEKLACNLTGLSSEKIPGKRTKRRHAESLVRTDPAHLPWHVGPPPAVRSSEARLYAEGRTAGAAVRTC